MTAMVEDGSGSDYRLPLSPARVRAWAEDLFAALVAARQRQAAADVAAHVRRLTDDELFALGLREDDIDRLRRRTRAERPPRPLTRYCVIGKVKTHGGE